MKKRGGFLPAVVLCAVLAITGCSDSDSDDVFTVTGVASSGAPIAGTVLLKDANGSVLGPETIGADGSFSFNVTGYVSPFVLKATAAASGASVYSYAAGIGRTNVNPLTTLVVAAAAEVSDPASVYDDPPTISDSALSTAVAAVQTVFANLYGSFGVDAEFNPLSGDCTVNHVGIDALFDAVDITIDSGTGNVTVAAADSSVLATTSTTGIGTATPITQGDADSAASQVAWAGTYNYCELFLDTPSGGSNASAAAGYITIAANGTWTAVNEATSYGELDDSVSGTYTIDAQGRFWINGTQCGAMTPDGEIAIIPDVDAVEGLDVGLTILCKRDTTLTDADLSGEYVNMSLYRDTAAYGSGASAEVIAITLNGDGTYSSAIAGDGTYSVDANGRFTVNDEQYYGMVAKSGEFIVMPDYSIAEGQDVGISILVKTSTLAGWENAGIVDDYNFAEMFVDREVTGGSTENAVNAACGALSFDGAGSYTGTIAYSSAGETGDVGGTYTAQSSYDIYTLNCFVADESFGLFTPDGEIFAVPDDDSDEGEDVGITLGVKAW